MAQINREREDKFFEILGQLVIKFYEGWGDKLRRGYWLNDSFIEAIKDIRYWDSPFVSTILDGLERWTESRIGGQKFVEAIENFFNGIEENIDLQSGRLQERYIYSLLVPFAELCDDRLDENILLDNELDLDFANMWGLESEDNINRAHSISDKIKLDRRIWSGVGMYYTFLAEDDQDKTISKQEQQAEADVLLGILNNILLLKRIREYVGARLDALLLERGINLLWYQNQCGVHLVKRRRIMKLTLYLGTPELVVKYIDEALPKIDETSEERLEQKQEIATDIFSEMPYALRTAEAREIFKRAEDAGLLSISGNCVKWNGEKQLLAYFAARMSDEFGLQKREYPGGEKQYRWQPFEMLFNTKGLRTARANCMKYNGVFKPNGSEEIDRLFD